MKKIFLNTFAIALAVSCSFANNSFAQDSNSGASGFYVEEDYIATPAANQASQPADYQPLPEDSGVEVAPQPMAEPNSSSNTQNQPMIGVEESITTVTE